MDLADDLGPGQRQQLVVTLDVMVQVLEALAAVGRLVELVALDHRAHRAVEDQDALGKSLAQGRFGRADDAGRAGSRHRRNLIPIPAGMVSAIR